GPALMSAITRTRAMLSYKMGSVTALINRLRQIFAAAGSSFIIVMADVLAGDVIDHNAASVVAFNQISLVLFIECAVKLLLTVIYINDKNRKHNNNTHLSNHFFYRKFHNVY
ncbi:MAG: hypothetical protein BZ138_03095, partial [Methanosphaera sp. rholeuAM270]